MPEHTELPHTTSTPIQNRYSFWYKQKGVAKPSTGDEQGQRSKENGPEDYESSITELASFQTLENFWKVYNHINVRKQLRILALSRALRVRVNVRIYLYCHTACYGFILYQWCSCFSVSRQGVVKN